MGSLTILLAFSLKVYDICKVLRFASLLRKLGGGDFRLIYRHYATLYFVFCVDSAESELGVLDLIQVIFLVCRCA